MNGLILVQRQRLKVPSAVMPDEFNYLLNPEHDDFADIELGDIEPYPIDERIGEALRMAQKPKGSE